MFSSWKIYLGIGIGVTVLLSIGAAAWYFNWSQDTIAVLEADKAKLELVVDEQQATIASMKAFAEKQAQDLLALQSNLASSEVDKSKLSELLAKHDLTALARSKPKLIEQRINDASKKALKDLSRGKP
jgi:hypothetical protein